MIYNIAIDGPAGAGKSTIARRVAKELSFIYVDTGAMYRAMALYLLHKNVDRTNTEQIGEVCQNAEISIEYQNGEQIVLLNGENVNAYLRTEEVGNMASVSSAVPRDIGTTILPDADVKIYLTASSLTRAKRRYLELQEKGTVCDLDNIQKDIEERDQRDMNREISPLRQAEDAVLVDSSDLTIEQVVDRILEIFRARTEEGASHES